MNILFLTTHLNAGGITSYLLTLSKGFIRRGHKIYVATSGGDRAGDFSAVGAPCVTLNIRTKSEVDLKIYKALSPLYHYIRTNDIDIIHAQTRITQVMGWLLEKLTGKIYLSTCHGFFKKRLSRRLAPCWGDAVIAISTAVRSHLLEDFRVPADNVFLIEHGIDCDAFAPPSAGEKKRNRKRFHLDHNCPVVGHIARLSDVKGQDVLIRAMKRIINETPQVKLLIVGQGKMEAALKQMVRALNLENHVLFYPVVNKTPQILSLFDIFVMPSRQEGLGLSVMEAQALGLPVVASNVGGIPSLIENGKTGILVKPEDDQQLAEAIQRLLCDKKAAAQMGQAARVFIQERYSADQMVDKTLNLYGRLMRKKA